MKKRFLSMLMAIVLALGMLPHSAFAAGSVDEALGEVDIYNGGSKFSYLSMNGRVQSFLYTYYNFVNSKGEVKEIPAYCVNPNLYGVPQTVAEGESIKYLAQEKSSDPKVMGIIANGYPTRSLQELGLDNKYQAYYATKMALWCYIISGWDISKLKVNPSLTGDELIRGNKMLAAAKDIYARGVMWDKIYEPNLTCTPDRDSAYKVMINGKEYKQQVFTVNSETWICNNAVSVSFADPDAVPAGTRIVDMNNRDVTTITTTDVGNGYAGQFKVLYPIESVKGKDGSVQFSLRTEVYRYGIYYAVCQEKNKYGNLQNYMCDTDPTAPMNLSAISSYYDSPVVDIDTGLKIIKLETGTDEPLEGALFEVIDPVGATVGTFATDSDGIIALPLTLCGNYTVIERKPAPNHTMPANNTQNVTVEYGKIATVTFYNDPFGYLRVQKLSNTGRYLSGVTVQVKNIGTGVVYTKKTTAAGVAVFDVPPGQYEVKEVAGIPGWIADTETTKTIKVVTGESSTVTLTNKELPGLRIIKYDRKSHEVMQNVTFEIFRDNESLGQFTTDAFGEIFLPDCQPGSYRAIEKDTGDSAHILVTTAQDVELHAGDGVKELVFFNDLKPGIRLVKVDSSDYTKTIANAVFEIRAVDGSFGPKEFRTDKNGEIDLSELPATAMVVREKACAGYVIDDAERIIYLKPNQNAQFVFTNSKNPRLLLQKMDANAKPLAGVTYRLTKIEDGSRYLDRTTSATGEIVWDNLTPGVYSLKEVATLETHILDPKEYHVELFAGRDSTVVLANNRRPNLTIHKSNATTGEPVEGAVFTVRAADGSTVTEVKTGKDGTAVVRNLLPITFEVVEKSVPEPYLLDAPSQLIRMHPNRDSDIYFTNHTKPDVIIIKENEITHDPIPHTIMEVVWRSNKSSTGEIRNLGTYETDEKGQIVLEDLEDGWLTVTEKEPAPGFSFKEPVSREFFIKGGETKTVRFENTPLSAIVIYKYDSKDSTKPIQNAVFQLRYLSGNSSGTGGTVIGTYRTSANGTITVTGLREGNYIIEELASDSDHVVDSAPQTVYISGKQQDIVSVYFGNAPKGSLTVKKIDADSHKPLSDVQFLVTKSDGSLVGDNNGVYKTDSSGSFTISGILPGTTLIVKETMAKSGYLLDDTAHVVRISAGQAASLEVRNQKKGNLIINKLSSADKSPLAGVQFKITYADGSYVDAADGKLSSRGLYTTDKNGQIKISGIVGTVVVTEVATIDGYTINEKTRTQTVVVNPNDTQTLTFYNDPIGGIEIIKVNSADRSERIANVTFEIRTLSGALVKTVTTGKTGRVFTSLEDGSYYAVEVDCPSEFKLDDTPIYFEIRGGQKITKTVTNDPVSGIIIHKIDSSTGKGIYGVKFVLYDASRKPIGEYASDHRGYVYIDDVVSEGKGKFYLRELEAAPGYELDTQYKTVYVQAGKTVEIEWENKAVTGQIQIRKYASEANPVTGTSAGAPLAGAVYEITDARSGSVVDYITTDARGVAASKPLPLTRYQIREVSAPAYFQLSNAVYNETLEYAGQIIKLSDYDRPVSLGVAIQKAGNREVQPGQSMSYTISGIANTSNVPLNSFYWHDRLPTDATRGMSLSTGTYNQRLYYKVAFKTNLSDYRTLASNLLTSNNYTINLNANTLGLVTGEYVTDIRFEFGTVASGFASSINPTIRVQVLDQVSNGYQIINRADVGGQYLHEWQTAKSSWVTVVRRFQPTTPLPKTGY